MNADEQEQVSSDGTHKWKIKVGINNFIETVFIPGKNRGTLCISSQVGCILNCSFCSTGKQGFNRNLTSAEIIGQLWLAKNILKSVEHPKISVNRVTNVVMMGMGEPLLNFEAVLPALRLMRYDNAYGLSKRRVTLSTSGMVPEIDKLALACDVALAISLHAPTDELRNQLVPLNKKYPIRELISACKRYIDLHPQHHITIEYVMLKDINDTSKHAKQLIKVLANLPCKVNLIPFNPFPGTEYLCSDEETINQFKDLLSRSKIFTTIRTTMGDDIDGACGQLAGQIIDKTHRNKRFLQKANLETKSVNIAYSLEE